MTTSDSLTDLYRARLSTATAGLLAQVAMLWQLRFDPTDPSGSLAAIGRMVGIWTTAAQAGAQVETLGYLQALYADAAQLALAEVAPFQAPEGLVGSSAAGPPLLSMTGQAPAVYWARKGSGLTDEQAAAGSLS